MTYPEGSPELSKTGRAGAQAQAPVPLTYPRIVDDITRSGITQTELSKAVGTSLRTVQNWAAGNGIPAGPKVRRLLDVQYIVRELRDAYTEEGVQIWLHARNRNLGSQRPIDLLAAGQYDEVLAEAERVSGPM
jgi:transcriptional regulator with XRE-family HTH domain